MKLIPVALAIFHRIQDKKLQVWTQVREDDGPYHGLLEFPGGGIEAEETPLKAVIREVDEEVGICITQDGHKFIGIYPNESPQRTILLYVFLFPDQPALEGKGKWLDIQAPALSSIYKDQIPGPNHKIIDDLYSFVLGAGVI